MAKKEISTGRKVFNGVALLGLIGGVAWLGVKFGGQFPAANALPGLQSEVAELGMPASSVVLRSRATGEPNGGTAVKAFSEKFETDFNFRQEIIQARWDGARAYALLTENTDVGNWIASAGEAAAIDLGRDYDDYEFEEDVTYMALAPMSMTTAHAAHQAFDNGDAELSKRYFELAWNMADDLGKEPFLRNALVYNDAMQDVYRYTLEMLDQHRNSPEALAIATEIFAKELDTVGANEIALGELYKVRMAARNMGSEATRYHMSAANWFKGPPAADDPDLELDPDIVRTWYGLPWGPKAADLVEIQVVKDLMPLLKDIASYGDDVEKINARVAEFREAFPEDPPEDITGVTPRIFMWDDMRADTFTNVPLRQRAGRGVCQVIAAYQGNGNVFPEGLQLSDGLSYRKTQDGFRVNVDGTGTGYSFPMPEVTAQSEMPAAAGGGG